MADFDFTQADFEETMNQVKWDKLQHRRRKHYKVEGCPGGTALITFVMEDDEEFTCLYPCMTAQSIYESLKEGSLPDLKGIYVKDFDISAILGERDTFPHFDARYSFWDGDVNFSHVTFEEGNVDFSEASFGEGRIDFTDVDFGDGDVLFRGASCNNGDVDFSGSRFGSGDVYFSYALFGEGNIDFSRVDFSKSNIFFSYAIFADGDVLFHETKFGNETVSFRSASFGIGSVSFRKMSANGALFEFDHAKFESGTVTFDEIDCAKSLMTFHQSSFKENPISFLDAHVHRLMFMGVKFNATLNLKMKSCYELVLQSCIIEKIVQCDTCRFHRLSFYQTVNFGQIYIFWASNIAWYGNGLLDRVRYNRFYKNKLFAGVPNAIEQGQYYVYEENKLKGRDFLTEEKSRQFQMLKENFHAIGQYQDEDLAYRTYMDHQTRTFDRKLEKLFYLIFGKVGGFGTRPSTIVITSVGVITFFGLLYTLLIDFNQFFSKFWGWWYTSMLIFFTFGERGVSTPLTMILSGFEIFFGVMLIAYFTVTLMRKLLR